MKRRKWNLSADTADLHNLTAQDRCGVNQLLPVTYSGFW
jgi:hypothetical protein